MTVDYEAQQGIWTLTAPDGRTWTGPTPMRTVCAEQADRVPADVRLARIQAAVEETERETQAELDSARTAGYAACREDAAKVCEDFAFAHKEHDGRKLSQRPWLTAELLADKIRSLSPPEPVSGRVSGWIPVSERLPEACEYVLIYQPDAGSQHRIAYHMHGKWRWPSGSRVTSDVECHPTHWQPLPEPPFAASEKGGT